MRAKTIMKKRKSKKVEEELLNSLKKNDEGEHNQQSGRNYRTSKPLRGNNKDST